MSCTDMSCDCTGLREVREPKKEVPEPIDFGDRPLCMSMHRSGWVCDKLEGHKSKHRYVR